jgi:hypothetical protein
MLSKKFWDTAKVVSAEAYRVPCHDYDKPKAYSDYTVTHCGTAELGDIHERTQQSCRVENVVSIMVNQALNDGIGHFVYYCPVSRQYSRAEKLLKSLGFKKISSFTHFGYVDRRPDYGRTHMWSLCLTHNEMKRVKELNGSVA